MYSQEQVFEMAQHYMNELAELHAQKKQLQQELSEARSETQRYKAKCWGFKQLINRVYAQCEEIEL